MGAGPGGASREAGGAPSTWAIVVAAGAGERLAADRPKALVELDGRPLVQVALERLVASHLIDAVIVAAPPGWEKQLEKLARGVEGANVVAIVAGGATRAESVANALARLPDDAERVIVHDAARPLVAPEVVARVLEALRPGIDGVVPAQPLVDTVKRVEHGVVTETLDRSGLVAVQTPQAFFAASLRAAYAGEWDDATDCASLVERSGGRVVVVDGDPFLLKVTTRDDLDRMAELLAPGERP